MFPSYYFISIIKKKNTSEHDIYLLYNYYYYHQYYPQKVEVAIWYILFFSFQRNSECFLAVKEWDNKLQLSDNEK